MRLLLWLLNGTLVIAYTIWGRIFASLLLIPLVWMFLQMPRICGDFYKPELRPWFAAITTLCVISAIFSPSPVPLFLLLMALVSAVVAAIEKFNPATTYWTIISGMALYALVGIGFAILVGYLKTAPTSDSLASLYLGQGQNYIGILGGFSLYMLPIVYIGLLVRGLLVHPPSRGPNEIAKQVRTRGWK